MNTLNLTRINFNSPYRVWQTSEGDYNFESDFGVLYRICHLIIHIDAIMMSNPCHYLRWKDLIGAHAH